MTARTLYDKLWDDHVVHTEEDGTAVLYIDRHLVHEVTSPQAFEGLRAGRPQGLARRARSWPPPTTTRRPPAGSAATTASPTRSASCRSTRSTPTSRRIGAAAYFPFLDKRQGIVHVIGPEQGATLPGMTVVCGDSHT